MIGTVLGGIYTLKEKLSEGGMAEVYRAEVNLDAFDYTMLYAYTQVPGTSHGERMSNAESFAGDLKKGQLDRETIRHILEAHHIPLPGAEVALKVAHDNMSLERFEAEWRHLVCLSHDNVIQVYGGGTHAGRSYYAMELLPQLISTKKVVEQFSLSEKLLFLEQSARGLQYLHENGIIHRDVKPDNLLAYRLADGRFNVKISDLGISKNTEEDLGMTMAQTVMGTPSYMSPEQARSARDVDLRADIYSLGATMYRLLTHSVPYRDKTSVYEVIAAISQNEPPVPAMLLTPDLPDELIRILECAMAFSPDERYDAMEELIADLNLYRILHAEKADAELAALGANARTLQCESEAGETSFFFEKHTPAPICLETIEKVATVPESVTPPPGLPTPSPIPPVTVAEPSRPKTEAPKPFGEGPEAAPACEEGPGKKGVLGAGRAIAKKLEKTVPIPCSACQARLKVPVSRLGQIIQCPKCQDMTALPDREDLVTRRAAPQKKAGRTRILCRCMGCGARFKAAEELLGSRRPCPRCKEDTLIAAYESGDSKRYRVQMDGEERRTKARKEAQESRRGHGIYWRDFADSLTYPIKLWGVLLSLSLGAVGIEYLPAKAAELLSRVLPNGSASHASLIATVLAGAGFLFLLSMLASILFTLTEGSAKNLTWVPEISRRPSRSNLNAFLFWALIYFGPFAFFGFLGAGAQVWRCSGLALTALCIMVPFAPMAFLLVALSNRGRALDFTLVTRTILANLKDYGVLIGMISGLLLLSPLLRHFVTALLLRIAGGHDLPNWATESLGAWAGMAVLLSVTVIAARLIGVYAHYNRAYFPFDIRQLKNSSTSRLSQIASFTILALFLLMARDNMSQQLKNQLEQAQSITGKTLKQLVPDEKMSQVRAAAGEYLEGAQGSIRKITGENSSNPADTPAAKSGQ